VSLGPFGRAEAAREDVLVVIPFQVSADRYSMFVGLQASNLERIQAYDPAEVAAGDLPPPYDRLRLQDIIIGWVTPEDLTAIEDGVAACDIRGVMQRLTRGYRYRPDRGDGQPAELVN